jgi:hypothetical protein
MTKKISDIRAKVGEYTNKNGETKGKWIDVGYVLQFDDGGELRCYYQWINLAGIPKKDGYDAVILKEFAVKEKSADAETHKGFDKQGDIPAAAKVDDEIPF